MNRLYGIFENLSVATGVGVIVLDTSGDTRFASSIYNETAAFLLLLTNALDCTEADRIALLYGGYQARRFGGQYIFFTPSGLAYCTSPLIAESGEMKTSVVAGPFLMTDHDEYMDIDVIGRHGAKSCHVKTIRNGLHAIPLKTPVQARAVSEQLFICAVHCSRMRTAAPMTAEQSVFPVVYSMEKENELLDAISMGDASAAGAILNDILGQVLFNSGSNLEMLRLRIVELTVLLSRAALKGGASIDAIFGLNYSFLREIDALSSVEDTVLWLHSVTRRFAQHVFDNTSVRHMDVIRKATAFIRRSFAEKISLQDVSDHVYLSVTYFSKIFKEETGQTPGQYTTSIRIEESKRLLRDPSVSIASIPELVGFEGQSYFTRVFKKAEGCTPGRFRQKLNEAKNA